MIAYWYKTYIRRFGKGAKKKENKKGKVVTTGIILPQNLLAFCRPVQTHFLSTSLSKISIFFCLSVLNVLLFYLTCNYFTFFVYLH